MDDPSLKHFANMYEVDRARYGFSPLPKDARVYVEIGCDEPAPCGYDARLRIDDKAYHHIAFRKADGVYRWVGEQEICRGSREYHSVDGNFKERVIISYFEHTASQAEGLVIEYHSPEDPMGLQKISITRAKALLKSWGYE